MNNVNIYQFYEDNYVSLQDYNKLQSNWNSLREWLQSAIYETFDKYEREVLQDVLDKMNELEGVDNNVED